MDDDDDDDEEVGTNEGVSPTFKVSTLFDSNRPSLGKSDSDPGE